MPVPVPVGMVVAGAAGAGAAGLPGGEAPAEERVMGPPGSAAAGGGQPEPPGPDEVQAAWAELAAAERCRRSLE